MIAIIVQKIKKSKKIGDLVKDTAVLACIDVLVCNEAHESSKPDIGISVVFCFQPLKFWF